MAPLPGLFSVFSVLHTFMHTKCVELVFEEALKYFGELVSSGSKVSSGLGAVTQGSVNTSVK